MHIELPVGNSPQPKLHRTSGQSCSHMVCHFMDVPDNSLSGSRALMVLRTCFNRAPQAVMKGLHAGYLSRQTSRKDRLVDI